MGELKDTLNEIEFGLSAARILQLLKGQPLDEIIQASVETAINRLESASKGFRYAYAQIHEGGGFLGMLKDIKTYTAFNEINSKVLNLVPLEFSLRLDIYAASLRSLMSKNGSIPKETKKELTIFYEAMFKFYNSKLQQRIKH